MYMCLCSGGPDRRRKYGCETIGRRELTEYLRDLPQKRDIRAPMALSALVYTRGRMPVKLSAAMATQETALYLDLASRIGRMWNGLKCRLRRHVGMVNSTSSL
jgi:hypothetical protein